MTVSTEEFLSLFNFQQAWYKVKENKGCAGVDYETIADFAQKEQANLSDLRESVANSTYQPQPYKQVLIPKDKDKFRELRIPSVRDRIVQQALLNVIRIPIEREFSPCSFAYRPNMSYIQAVEKVAYWRDEGFNWVLDADIVKYFDNIDHQQLLIEVRQHIENPGILCLIKSWISAGIKTDEGLELPEKGIPQGAVVSPLLANIYLDKFDHTISNSDVQLVRYADDFLVMADSYERINQAYREVVRLLNYLKLSIHQGKTQITNFDRGFRFLGHGFLENAIFPIEKEKAQAKSSAKKKVQVSRKNNRKGRRNTKKRSRYRTHH